MAKLREELVAVVTAHDVMRHRDPNRRCGLDRPVRSRHQLLQARTQLANLITYMDGKTGAEELIAKVLSDRGLMQALASAPNPEAEKAGKSE